MRKHGIDVEYNYPRFNIWPINIKKFWISSFFGKRVERARGARFHSGLDLAALKGTKVYAVANGKVKEAKKIPGYGNSIVLVHSNKYQTKYAHLDKILVKKNTKVKKGSIIGTVGDTGFVVKNGKDASHLHFEVIEKGKQVNPLKFLPILNPEVGS